MGGGRSTVVELQAEINRRLQDSPAVLQELNTQEDAEKWIAQQRIGLDCAGFVSRVFEEAFARSGRNFYEAVGTSIGNISASSFLQWAKEGKGGFSVLPDKASNILKPGTIIVLTEGAKKDTGVHVMIVIDTVILNDGSTGVIIAESTDQSEFKKGVHAYTLKINNLNTPLSEQSIIDQAIDLEQVQSDNPALAKVLKQSGRRDYGVRFWPNPYANPYVIIGNSSFGG